MLMSLSLSMFVLLEAPISPMVSRMHINSFGTHSIVVHILFIGEVAIHFFFFLDSAFGPSYQWNGVLHFSLAVVGDITVRLINLVTGITNFGLVES